MPLSYAHVGRIASPGQFDSFATQKNAGGAGVDFLYGIKNGKSKLASVRFDKTKFTPTRARQWLKKHGLSPIEFATAQEGVQAEDMAKDIIAEVINQPSYEQLGSLVQDALDKAYPPQMSEYGYSRSVYQVHTLWPDRALIRVNSGIPESATSLGKNKYGLVTFKIDMAENEVELDNLIPASIQAVPTSGEPVVLDEADSGSEKDGNGWMEAGRRNSSKDAGALNKMARLALSLMGESDLEPETHAMLKKRVQMKKKIAGMYEGDLQDEDFEFEEASDAPWNGDKSRFSIEQLMRSVPRAMARWARSQASKENRDVIKSDLHLPYKEPDGTINLGGVRNALARAPLVQGVPAEVISAAKAELQRALGSGNKKEGVGFPDDGFEEAKWTVAFINSLPDSSFAYVRSGEKDKEGKTVPRSNRFLPYRGTDGKTIDMAHLRNALARLNQTDLTSEEKAKAQRKLEAAAKEAGVGDRGKKEGVEFSDDDIVEGWQGMPGETLHESFVFPLAEAKIEKTDKEIILHNVFILGPKSANGRGYSESVQRKALPLFEGMKAYLNHPAKNELSEPRKVQDLIGEYKNVHVLNSHTIGDMHLLNNETVRETVLPIAEHMPHLVGNSIVARGSTERKDGIDEVTEIHAVRSADLVTEPATTNQLFAEGRMEEDEMEFKSLTLEQLKRERPDLYKEVVESQQSVDRQKLAEDENKALRESLAERDGKIAQFELRDAKRDKQDQVSKLMREAKIPDKVKYAADGKIKPHFLNLLERCDKEEDLKALLADWEETYRQGTGVISESKELPFGNGDISPSVYERTIQAFAG